MSYEQERFFRRANTAADVATGAVLGYVIYRGAHNITARGWALFIGACAAGIISLYSLGDPWENSSTGDGTVWTLRSIVFALACIVLFVCAAVDTYQNAARQAAAAQAAQFEWDQQQAAAGAQRLHVKKPPVATQRVERTVTIVRAQPQPAQRRQNVATYKRSDVRLAIAEKSQQRRPVRNADDHGSFTIDDRRPFDPDLGEQ